MRDYNRLIISFCVVISFSLINISQVHCQLYALWAQAQKNELLDSLPGLEGIEKLKALNTIALACSLDNPDSTVIIASEVVELASDLGYPEELANAYFNLGHAYFLIDSLKLSVINYLNALRIYETLPPKLLMGLTCENLCLLNWMVGRTQEAVEYNRREINIANELDYWAVKFYALSGMSTLFERMKQYDSAYHYINKAFEIVRLQGDTSYIFLVNYRLSSIKLNQGLDDQLNKYHFKESIESGLKVLDLADQVLTDDEDDARTTLYLTTYQRLSMAYMALGTDSSRRIGRDYLYKAKYIADTINFANENKIQIYKILAVEQSIKGNYPEAIRLYKKGIEGHDTQRILRFELITTYFDPYIKTFVLSNYKDNLQSVYDSLYLNYQRLGNFKQALYYYVLKEKIDNEIFIQNKQNLVKTLEAKSEQEKIGKQIAMLERDREINALKVYQSKYYIYGLSAFIVVVVLFGFIFFRMRKIRSDQKALMREQQLNHDLELKELEASKLREVDKMKSRFFANISHEFRTPLTLILGPLENLKKSTSHEKAEQELNLILRNARRLQTLINQLLDLSKLESGKMELHAGEENIVKLSKTYFQSFESLARIRKIDFSFASDEDNIQAFVDREKYEQIFYNLISNAIKFTPDGGKIAVKVSGQQSAVSSQNTNDLLTKQVIISVTDTGKGIAPGDLDQIFDRFYQAGDKTNSHEGTGIGLALVRELVELHHGKISVESEPGIGSTFTVVLPLEQPIVKGQQSTVSSQQSAVSGHRSVITTQNPELKTHNSELPLLLIVEDNADMRDYIRSIMPEDYNLIEAVDGEQGLEVAIKNIPDLVISDVMMPRMDGIEFTHRLKADERTSHIPVILLTAKAALEDRLEGLETGADDFLTKPFNQQELIVRVKNLILQRKKLQENFFRNAMSLGLSKILHLPECGINSTDQAFLIKAINIVNDHITDENFSADMLHDTLAMSYMQLYRKLKSLLGQSVSGFIRSIRLSRAAELIRANSGTITEIAYQVGFNSLSYFSKCFEEEFGVLPSHYNEQQVD